MAEEKKYWMGGLPMYCDICLRHISEEEHFVDGRIDSAVSWAIMCEHCHERYGAGLGTGCGQKYDVKTLEKVEG